jgi:nicotinamidase-related amidase
MPLSTLDPTPALVVIDLQKGLLGWPVAHPLPEILRRAAELAHAFRQRGLPVVLVNAAGAAPGRTEARRPVGALPPDWTELADELGSHPDDHKVTKTRWGAFHGTSLDAYLRDRHVTQVVLAGVATSIGVESTARAAYEHGYNVVLATDAMTDPDRDAHDHSVGKIFPRLGETAAASEILTMLSTSR